MQESYLFNLVLKKIVHIFMLFRNFYHVIILSLLVRKNNKSSCKNWLIIFNSERNLEMNTAAALIVNKMISYGWHHKIVFTGNSFFKNFSLDKMTKQIKIGKRVNAKLEGKIKIHDNWKINFNNRTAILQGINFYNIIDSSLANFEKAYQLDYRKIENKVFFEKTCKSMTCIISYCSEIKRYVESGKNIRIILFDADRLPNALVLKFFESKNLLDKINLYTLGQGYGIYNDSGNWHSGNIMLTKSNPQYAHHYYAWSKDFFQWYNKNREIEKKNIDCFVNEIFSSKHYLNKEQVVSSQKETLIKTINLHRSNNLKVYCLFSHLFFDRPIIDETCYFSSMLNWIDETIEIFKKDKNKVLLIKPHIVETFYPKAKQPKQKLSNYLFDKELTKNIIVLEPNIFLADEVRKYVDGSIIWRSTAHVENISSDCPSLYCGPKAAYSSVIATDDPKNREEYNKLINDLPNKKYTSSEIETARALIYFLNKIKTIPINCYDKLPSQFGDNVIINPTKIIKSLKQHELLTESLEKTLLENNYGASRYEY